VKRNVATTHRTLTFLPLVLSMFLTLSHILLFSCRMWARLPSKTLGHVNRRALSMSKPCLSAGTAVAPRSRLEVMEEMSLNAPPGKLPNEIDEEMKNKWYPQIGKNLLYKFLISM